MSLYIPSQSEIAEVSRGRGADSDAPDLWRGLVGWWPMQEGGGATAFDASGYRRSGTWNGIGTHHGIGRIGRDARFNGTDDYVQVALNLPEDAPWTASMWIWHDSTNDGSFLSNVGTSNEYERLRLRSSGVFNWVNRYNINVQILAAHPTNQWFHLGLACDGKALSATAYPYVDGAAQTPVVIGNDTRFSIDRIGSRAAGNPFAGRMAHVAIHNRALLPSEIAQLYADPWAMGRLRRRVFPVAVSSTTPVVVADAYHLHTADSPAIIHRRQLTAAAAAHLHTATSPSVYHRYHPGLVVLRVSAESRTLLVPAANRTLRVPAESRTLIVSR